MVNKSLPDMGTRGPLVPKGVRDCNIRPSVEQLEKPKVWLAKNKSNNAVVKNKDDAQGGPEVRPWNGTDFGIHFLASNAFLDSKDNHILNLDEVDRMKKEFVILQHRVESYRRQLAMETRIRDATCSMSRLDVRLGRPNQHELGVVHSEKVNSIADLLWSSEKKMHQVELALTKHHAAVLGQAFLDQNRRLDVQKQLQSHAPDLLAHTSYSKELSETISNTSDERTQVYNDSTDDSELALGLHRLGDAVSIKTKEPIDINIVCDKVESLVKSHDSLSKELDGSRECNVQLHEDNERLRRENSSLQDLHRSMQDQLKESRESHQKLIEQKRDLHSHHEKVVDQHERLKIQHKEASEALDKRKREDGLLQSSLDKEKGKVRDFQDREEALSVQLNETRERENVLQNTCTQNQNSISALKDEVAKLREQNSAMISERDSALASCEQVKRDNEAGLNGLKASQEREQVLEKELQSMLVDFERLTKLTMESEQALACKDKTITELMDEQAGLRAIVADRKMEQGPVGNETDSSDSVRSLRKEFRCIRKLYKPDSAKLILPVRNLRLDHQRVTKQLENEKQCLLLELSAARDQAR